MDHNNRSCRHCGLYYTKNDETYINIPQGMIGQFFCLMVVRTAYYTAQPELNIFLNQIIFKYSTNKIYTRSYRYLNGGMSWNQWEEVVFNSELGISETERKIGTWLDGSPLYEKAILFSVPQNGEYSIPINVTNLKNVVRWTGNFFQGGYSNPAWIMHIPYTYLDRENLANMINIYVYYNSLAQAFYGNFYGSGIYENGYFTGQGILYVQYTKNL